MLPPLLFHPLKHHLGYLRHFVQDGTDLDFWTDLPRIGASQMDLYCGELSPVAIGLEIRTQLEERGALAEDDFLNFLGLDVGYQTLVLSDDSSWTLRLGNEPGRYVHIHPGRYAPHSVRVKAGALKTALLLLRNNVVPTDGTAKVNELRESIGLSPIKAVAESQGITRIWEMLLNTAPKEDAF